ncbi:MAG: hypothetical protein U5L96_07165 [Owenweeksia sp.]|nr:hypothetical protein [Owenweeksia sp.]
MSDPGDPTTFGIVDTITYPEVDDLFRRIVINLDNTGLIGSATFFAIKYANAGGGWEFFIDDFVSGQFSIPACPSSTSLGVSNITSSQC